MRYAMSMIGLGRYTRVTDKGEIGVLALVVVDLSLSSLVSFEFSRLSFQSLASRLCLGKCQVMGH